MRIFLGLREIAGYYNSLRLGFEEVGIEARFVNLYNHKFQYGEPDKQLLSRICRATGAYKNSTKIIPLKMFYFAVHYFFRIILFLKCLFKYDVFIFGYNSTFFYYLDLPVLKFFNKKIIYVFHGSDSRPPYIDGAYIQSNPKPSIDDCFNETKRKKKILLIIEKYADHIINQLPQSYLHQRDFILKLAVGIPFESDIENISNTGSNKIFTILHSPSFPEAKGSETIETIIKELKKDGYKIELKKIQNMQNKIVIENILHCDLAIDQLYSDHPLAGFATEASYFGRAVIVGGYYLDYVNQSIPDKYLPPSLFIHPNDLKKSIVELYENKEKRILLGNSLREFVREKWSRKQVAKNFLDLIKNEYPSDWIQNPKDLPSIHMTCIENEKGIEFLRLYFKKYGKRGFFISDKPEIEAYLINMIEI